jgi:hypothetical protein
MDLHINNSTGGFRKWSEAQELKRSERARAGMGEGGVVVVSDVDERVVAPDEQSHRPWLVPGIGKL